MNIGENRGFSAFPSKAMSLYVPLSKGTPYLKKPGPLMGAGLDSVAIAVLKTFMVSV